MKDVAFGLVGGAVGAFVWAAVVYVTEYEIGWIAWGVGGLVGFCVALGNKDRGRSPTAAGTLAVVITALSIVAGKYAAVEMLMPSDAELVGMFTARFDEEEYVVSFLADDVAGEFQSAGREMVWPQGVDPANASSQSDYPPAVWAEAGRRWSEWSDDERATFRREREAQTRANVEANLPEIRAAISQGGFLGSFAPMDFIFFGLGMVTAFGMGSGRKTAEEVTAEFEQAIRLAMMKMMLADGSVGDDEVSTVAAVYQQLTGVELAEDAIRAEAAVAQSGGGADLLASLTALAPHLNDEAKETVVKAALMVALADGAVAQEEKNLIGEISAAVGMSETHLQGTIAQFTSST